MIPAAPHIQHMRRTLGITLLLLAAVFAGTGSACAAQRSDEYIICSGGPSLNEWEQFRVKDLRHDKWWGNFIRTARIRMQQIRGTTAGADVNITWLVYRSAYDKRGREDRKNYIDLIHSVRDAYNINLVWFASGQEIINYLNGGKNRRTHKISGFDYFGHSNKHCFLFDYSCDIYGASAAYLHEDQLKALRRGLFIKGAHVQSFGCHTAESMASRWKKATGVKMIGAVGKTDYGLSYKNVLPHINKGYWKR